MKGRDRIITPRIYDLSFEDPLGCYNIRQREFPHDDAALRYVRQLEKSGFTDVSVYQGERPVL